MCTSSCCLKFITLFLNFLEYGPKGVQNAAEDDEEFGWNLKLVIICSVLFMALMDIGWCVIVTYMYLCSTGFAQSINQEVVKKLVTEVKDQLPEVRSSTIKGVYTIITWNFGLLYTWTEVCHFHADATRTYFTSYCGVNRLKASGKYKAKMKYQRRKNRLLRVCCSVLNSDVRMT